MPPNTAVLPAALPALDDRIQARIPGGRPTGPAAGSGTSQGQARRSGRLTLVLIPLLGLALAACGAGEPSAAKPGAAPGGAPGTAAGGPPKRPPVSVSLATARQVDWPVRVEFAGTVSPVSAVEVRPQTTARIMQVHVREGQFVKAGDRLFTLDSRSDQANLARLQAQLAEDQAALADASRQLARNQDLLAQGFVSQGAVDSGKALVQARQAAVAAARAAITAGQVPVGQSTVLAPSSGRVGRIGLHPGSIVKANDTLLLTVTQLDPIDVSFALPQQYLAEALAALRAGTGQVQAQMPGQAQPVVGRLNFIDSAVDTATGTVHAKARFNNAAQGLWPGAYVKLAVTVRTLPAAIVVPQAAVIVGVGGDKVYVVEGKLAREQPVQVIFSQQGEAAITGIAAGARVVVEGRQNVRPGAAVVERAATGSPAASGPARDKARAGGAAAEGGASPASAAPAEKAAS